MADDEKLLQAPATEFAKSSTRFSLHLENIRIIIEAERNFRKQKETILLVKPGSHSGLSTIFNLH
ncbi:MAG: hypothetical protein Q9P90_03025 [candidate division KSB1 bacterium]|nr:hypothetical protein [candidate division KSB1 bacterium]